MKTAADICETHLPENAHIPAVARPATGNGYLARGAMPKRKLWMR